MNSGEGGLACGFEPRSQSDAGTPMDLTAMTPRKKRTSSRDDSFEAVSRFYAIESDDESDNEWSEIPFKTVTRKAERAAKLEKIKKIKLPEANLIF